MNCWLMECHIDHCHLFVNMPPTVSAAEAVKVIKSNAARNILVEFDAIAKARNL